MVSGLRAVCGTEPAHWSTKASVMLQLQQRQPFWQKWQAAGYDSTRLSSLIACLHAKHCNAGEQGETSGKRKASPASAGEARKVRKPSVASDEQKAGVQAVLCKMCGEEPDLWNTKKWVVEAVQCSSVGMELQAAGATVAHLQTLIWNLKQNALYQNSPHVRATKSAYSSEPHVRAARSAYYSGVSDAARMHTFQASSLAAQKFTMPLTAEAQAVQVARAIELGKEDLDAASLSRASTYVGLSKLRYFHHSCLTHSDIVVTAQL